MPATLDDFPGLRSTDLEGTLEIMSPSPEHELDKTASDRLIKIYALEMDIDLTGYGSTTFPKPAKGLPTISNPWGDSWAPKQLCYSKSSPAPLLPVLHAGIG